MTKKYFSLHLKPNHKFFILRVHVMHTGYVKLICCPIKQPSVMSQRAWVHHPSTSSQASFFSSTSKHADRPRKGRLQTEDWLWSFQTAACLLFFKSSWVWGSWGPWTMQVHRGDKCCVLWTLTVQHSYLSKRRDLSGLSKRGDRGASFRASVHLRGDPISLLERHVNNRVITGRFTEQLKGCQISHKQHHQAGWVLALVRVVNLSFIFQAGLYFTILPHHNPIS